MVFLVSLIAMLYPRSGEPPSDSGIPHSTTMALGPIVLISRGGVGGEGTAEILQNVLIYY